MHEMGIAQGILDASVEAALEQGATGISAIHVSIGDLTAVAEFALQFAFEALQAGTMAEDAALVVTTVPARSKCRECGHEYGHDSFQMSCPECGSLCLDLLQGRELQIDSIETVE